jgi:hypothetical protein
MRFLLQGFYVRTMKGKSKKNTKEVFHATIDRLKERAQDAGRPLTDQEIADSIGISSDVFNHYYKKDNAPEEIFHLLRKSYKDLIGTLRIEMYILSVDEDEPEDDDE